MPWCASVSPCSDGHATSPAIDSSEPGTIARVWLNHVRRHQMHLVKQAVNKGVHLREPQGRICGSVVRRRVMSCIVKCKGTGPRPRPLSSNIMGDKCAEYLLFEPLDLLIHWLALTDGQNTCESVKLPSYQPVGASVMSVNVVPMPKQCTGRPE